MSVTLQGRAKVRRVGNGLCIPIPTREAKAEGIKAGTEVDFIVTRPHPIPLSVFGSARRWLRGADLQAMMDEDRNERG